MSRYIRWSITVVDDMGEMEKGLTRRDGPDHLSLNPMVLVHLTFFAALGMAVKQLVYPLAILVLPGFLPVAPFTSGAYMLWLVAGRSITGFRASGTFIGLVQALAAFLMVFGRHGAFNLPLYLLTGIAVDIAFLLLGRFSRTLIGTIIPCVLASMVGTALVVGIELQMGREILIASMFLSASSGVIGGYLAHRLVGLHSRTIMRRVPDLMGVRRDRTTGP